MTEAKYISALPSEGTPRILKHILFWISVLTFFTLFELAISNGTLWYSIKSNIIYLPQDIILIYTIIFLLIPRFFVKKRYVLFAFGIVCVFLSNFLLSFLVDFYVAPLAGIELESTLFAKRLLSSIMSFTFIAGIATIIKLIEISNQIQFTKESTEAKFNKAELALLRSQVNPHFLFNVFNNIDELIYKDRDKASEILSFLSDSLRYVLQKSDNEFVPLIDELDFIRSYLKVASISYDNPEFINLEISSQCDSQAIAPMMFIPFIENCVKHCNRKTKSPGIMIDISCTVDSIELNCENEIKADLENSRGNSGFGLLNARKRLELTYPQKHELNIIEANGKYIVNLKIRLK